MVRLETSLPTVSISWGLLHSRCSLPDNGEADLLKMLEVRTFSATSIMMIELCSPTRADCPAVSAGYSMSSLSLCTESEADPHEVQIDTCLGDALDEARRFLSEPQPLPAASRSSASAKPRSSQCSSEVARRLFALSRPLKGTIAETYLARRGIVARRDDLALGFIPAVSIGMSSQAPPLPYATRRR